MGRTFDIAVPIGTEPIIRGAESSLDRRSSWWLRIMARLAPGQTIAQAEARLASFHQGLREATMPQDWRPQDQKGYIAQSFKALSGATGISGLRVSYSRPHMSTPINGRPRYQFVRSPRSTKGRPRQRGIRQEVLQRRQPTGQDVHDRNGAA